jgi:hypothetical protein
MEDIIKSIRCIVMETSGNPKLLFIDGLKDRYIGVKPIPENYDTPIYLKQETVFEYDEALFGELKHKFESGDMEGLKQAWEKATPLKLGGIK